MKRSIAVLAVSLALAAPAFAQGVKIDDDGWSLNERERSTGPNVSIDDDGWSLRDKPEEGGVNERVGTPGECSQMERSAGLSAEECGTRTRAEIARMLEG